jgi:hypothetical protein
MMFPDPSIKLDRVISVRIKFALFLACMSLCAWIGARGVYLAVREIVGAMIRLVH